MKNFFILLTLALVGCSQSEQWTAFVYPELGNIPGPENSATYIIGNFKAFDECQAAAISEVRAKLSTTGRQGAYMCGLNCNRNKDFGNLLVCQEKRK